MNFKVIAVASCLALTSFNANAIFQGRLAATAGGTDYQAYYDTDTDLTWLADANYAKTSGFDADGRMTWSDANSWAAGLDIDGTTGWRLVDTLQPDPSCSGQSGGTSSGFNCTGSEMGYLFNIEGITASASGPFINVQSDNYWSGTEFASNTDRAWGFHFNSGNQSTGNKVANLFAWAVQSGDVSASTVPEPAIVWLLAGGLLGIAGVNRIKR